MPTSSREMGHPQGMLQILLWERYGNEQRNCVFGILYFDDMFRRRTYRRPGPQSITYRRCFFIWASRGFNITSLRVTLGECDWNGDTSTVSSSVLHIVGFFYVRIPSL